MPMRWPRCWTVTGDAHPAVRAAALGALGNYHDPRIVPLALAALQDADGHVRASAARTLGHLKAGEAVQPLLAAARDTDVKAHGAALAALGEIGDPAALPALLEAMQAPEQEIRVHAAIALGNYPDDRAIEALAVAMNSDADYMIKSTAGQSLCASQAPAVAEVLLASLENEENPYLLSNDSKMLTAHKDRRIVELLLAHMTNRRYWDPAYVMQVKALGMLGDARAYRPLLKLLQSDRLLMHPPRRKRCYLRDARAVPALIVALDEESFPQHGYTGWGNDSRTPIFANARGKRPPGRWGKSGINGRWTRLSPYSAGAPCPARGAASAALGKLKDQRAVAPLIAVLPQLTGDARLSAAGALKNLTGADQGMDAEKWQQWLKAGRGLITGSARVPACPSNLPGDSAAGLHPAGHAGTRALPVRLIFPSPPAPFPHRERRVVVVLLAG